MPSGSTGRKQEDDKVVTIVGLTRIPEAIRGLDTLARPDYVDLVTATTSGAGDQSAEQWARATLEDTPTGRSAPLVWRRLGLRLGPMPSPDYVQGWKIAARGEGWIRVETSSSVMTAHAVVQVDDEQVSVALFLRFDRPIAARIWAPVSVLHRRAVPVMLRQAVEAHASRTRGLAHP
jgi:hypothetical protein